MALIPTGQVPEDYRRKLAYKLMMEGTDASPVQHWAQGLARLGQGALGGYEMYQADEKDKAAKADRVAAYLGMAGGDAGGPAPSASASPAAAPMTPPSAAPANYGNAISSIESGGKYDALGPVTKNGDRAYGKYQVMGNNIPQWTKEALGQEMTPQAFAASPEAQDKVFQSKFGSYAQKYGPEGAAKAWFAGEKGMNNPNAKDMLGTSVSSYGQKFMKALGGEQPYDVAGPATAAPGQGAQAGPQARPPVDPRIIQLLRGTPAQQEMGMALMDGQIAESFKPRDQWVDERGKDGSFYQRHLRTGERKVIEKSDVLPEEAVRQKVEIAKGSKPETTINNTVNPVLKGVGDRFNEDMDKARAARDQIKSIHEGRRAIDEGAFTGIAGDAQLFGSKVASLFGVDSGKAANTEVLRSAIGESVLNRAKTLGANPTNTDRDYIKDIVGGNIKLEENSIRRLMDMQERWARDSIKTANTTGQKLLAAQPKELGNVAPLFTIDEPEDYGSWSKNNPSSSKPAAPARSDIEQEMRRRGLLK